MLNRNAALMLPFTVRDRVCPISGNGHHGGGPRGSPHCQRALRVSRARRKHAKRVGCSCTYVARSGEREDCSRQGAGVRRFDGIIGARAMRKPALSLERP
jgi:hypothetical protein